MCSTHPCVQKFLGTGVLFFLPSVHTVEIHRAILSQTKRTQAFSFDAFQSIQGLTGYLHPHFNAVQISAVTIPAKLYLKRKQFRQNCLCRYLYCIAMGVQISAQRLHNIFMSSSQVHHQLIIRYQFMFSSSSIPHQIIISSSSVHYQFITILGIEQISAPPL